MSFIENMKIETTSRDRDADRDAAALGIYPIPRGETLLLFF
jgi:hypothetical protein